jgi:putative ABC transport system permease protein
MLWPIIKALLGHYRRHPLQIVLVWLGLTLGVSIYVGVAAINHHAMQSYTSGEQLFSHSLPYHIHPKQSAAKIPQGFYIQLRREGFTQCAPFDMLRVNTSDGKDIVMVGVDPLAMANIVPGTRLSNLSVLDMMQPPYPLVMNQELASYLRVQAGESVTLADGKQLGPVLIDKNDWVEGTRVLVDMAMIRRLNKTGGVSYIGCGNMPPASLDRLKRVLPGGMTLSRSSRTELESLTKAFHINLSAMGMLSFGVGLFIFYQAMSLSFIQRQTVVGTLRQMGASRWQLMQGLCVELLLLILLCWGSGNVFGLMLANQLIPTVSITLADLYDANVGFNITWSWVWVRESLLMCIAGTLLSCVWPLIRLLRTQPIRLSARLSLVRFAGMEFYWQALISGLCFIALVVVYQTQEMDSDVGFLVIALMMLGVALLAPFIIFNLFAVLSYVLKWVKVRWLFADAAASMSYRGVAVMGFMLAISATIAIETMIGSFRITTEHWLDQKLAADMYIYPTNSSALRITEWLSQQPEVESVWWRWEDEIRTSSGTIQVVSSGSSQGEQQALTVKVATPDYWYLLHNSPGVLISESIALKEGLRPGDYIALSQRDNTRWQVLGVYYDYGNPYGQMIVSHKNWMAHFGGRGNVALAVNLDGKEEIAELTRYLEGYYHLSPERVLDNSSLHDKAMRVFNRTFTIADTLGKLTLLVGVFGIFFATVAGEVSRQRQVALLRCFGMSGKELIMLSALQLFIFGATSALIAIPLGLYIAKVMVNVVLEQSFGWSIQFYMMPWDYLSTFVWTMAALMVAGVLPFAELVRRTPIKSLRDAL